MSINEDTERQITGRSWKDCPSCEKVRIVLEQTKCQGCGGPVTNCKTCGTGSRWWFRRGLGHICLNCGGDPLVSDDGRPDHKEYGRARMIHRFGPRMDGDVELLEQYKAELD